MFSRRNIKESLNRRKLLIGALFLILVIGSSVNVAFAGQDIHSLLSNWFNQQKAGSMTKMGEAIATEQEMQTKRLMEELQLEIELAGSKLEKFTDEMKLSSMAEIQRYTDELIHAINIDTSEERERITNELHQIVQEAMKKMEAVNTKVDPAPPAEDTESASDTALEMEGEGDQPAESEKD